MKERKRSVKKDIAHVICLAILAAITQTLFVLTIVSFHGIWTEGLYYLILTSGTVLNATLLSVEYVTYFLGKQVIYRFCIIAYVLAIFIAAIAYALIETGFLEVIRDAEKLEAYLERSGNWMAIVFILLQFSQVVLLPIPSTVTVVAGTALFGPFLGSVYSLIGIMIGSLTAFLIGRYAGYRVVSWMVGKETLDGWLKKIKGKDKLFLSAMFLLPVFPDDVLCFIAGLSSMSLLFFSRHYFHLTHSCYFCNKLCDCVDSIYDMVGNSYLVCLCFGCNYIVRCFIQKVRCDPCMDRSYITPRNSRQTKT